jgi:glutathione peroxidase
MMKAILLTCLLMSASPIFAQTSVANIYIDTLAGANKLDISKLRGRKVLVVNTESQDTSFSQFKELVLLQQKGKDKVLIIVFPSRNSAKELVDKSSLSLKYSQQSQDKMFIAAPVSFSGADMSPLYKWLTGKQYNGESSSEVKKPFYKYLMNEQGKLVGVYGPGIRPMNPILIEAIAR